MARMTRRAHSFFSQFFPRLAFEEPLEAQFRDWYAEQTHSRTRAVMWFGMGAVIFVMLFGHAFGAMRDTIFGVGNESLVDLLRFGIIASSAATMLVASHVELYRRWFSPTAQIVAPIHAASCVGLDVLMQQHGWSMTALMPLVLLAPYFLFGLLQAAAVRTALVFLLIYAVGGELGGVAGPQRYFDLCVMIFAVLMGAAVHYSQQRAIRQTYLSTQALNESLHRDALTGIHNRRMFDEHIARLWQQAIREQVPVGLLLIDLDHFKDFNDYAGHQAGDLCLTNVARLLPGAARRPLDLAARYGGEEFAVLLYDMKRDKVEELCRQLHGALAKAAIAHPASSVGPYVTFSIGAACVAPAQGRRPEGFIQLADEALYAAKERGRNRTVVMDREYETLQTGSFRAKRRHAA